jgi:hypothetical protein
MMSEITQIEKSDIQQAIAETIHVLSLSQQQAVLAFARLLSNATPTQLSLRELAKLSVVERNQILAAYVPMMIEDFEHDPELTEFSVLDGEDWEG